jgi:nitric oxide dioxygenase
MLTTEQRDIIKATVPLLEAGGEALTTHFYKILLADHPEVRPLFNQAHQANGAQPRALANGVLMYARNIDRLENLGSLAGQIVNKHVALQIFPEHYPIVGGSLLQAMREVLGPELATDEVIAAWAAAYQQLADILIGAERGMYDTIAATPGGWRGSRPFTVVDKRAESSEITSFYLLPVDGQPVIAHKAGQYIGLRINVRGQEIRRTYSLSAPSSGTGYRISVKRELNGAASNFLHDEVGIGSMLELFPPSGQFTLIDGKKPLVLISGGVGITPMMAIAQAALESGNRQVVFIHYARNMRVQGFQTVLDGWKVQYPQFSAYVVHSEESDDTTTPADAIGFPSVGHLEQWLPAVRDVETYFVGPKPFMAFIKRALQEIGVPESQSHHEFFGPAEALV